MKGASLLVELLTSAELVYRVPRSYKKHPPGTLQYAYA